MSHFWKGMAAGTAALGLLGAAAGALAWRQGLLRVGPSAALPPLQVGGGEADATRFATHLKYGGAAAEAAEAAVLKGDVREALAQLGASWQNLARAAVYGTGVANAQAKLDAERRKLEAAQAALVAGLRKGGAA